MPRAREPEAAASPSFTREAPAASSSSCRKSPAENLCRVPGLPGLAPRTPECPRARSELACSSGFALSAPGLTGGDENMRIFNFVVEKDPDTGIFVGHVPGRSEE